MAVILLILMPLCYNNIVKMKKTILIDLDGVLNDYVGNYDKDFIPPIKAGAKEFLTISWK